MTFRLVLPLLLSLLLPFSFAPSVAQTVQPTAKTADLEVTEAQVQYRHDLDLLVFEQTVAGTAGQTTPEPAGQLDGAPVLAYVFPTTLSPSAVGFGDIEGTLALVATSHPDFDDTPLWDEGMTGAYDDDGAVWHSHWVVLRPDERLDGTLAVVEIDDLDDATVPPTHPDMPIYLDSPGHSVVLDEDTIRILVPAFRVSGETTFNFDAVTAYLEVNTSDDDRPMLGVYEVYDILSDDLSLPYAVEK